VGFDLLRTQDVRVTDSRGRHTSTARQLVLLESGGILIDTPGMRELQLWESGDAFGDTFADIVSAAESCRFRDCRHLQEPGCAVRAAVASGALPAGRLESFHKLAAEREHQERQLDARALIEDKRKARVMGKALQKRLKEKGNT
jgi:ribosome biogenesis GTPase / thiamine phosphate phosphatase